MLGKWKSSSTHFEFSAVVWTKNGAKKIGYYLKPLSSQARNYPVMEPIKCCPEVPPYGYQLDDPVLLSRVTKNGITEILDGTGIEFRPQIIDEIDTAINEYKNLRNTWRQEAAQTDFSKPPVIGTYDSLDNQYTLMVELHPMEHPVKRTLPYSLQYFVKAADQKSEQALKTALGLTEARQRPDGAYYVFEHTTGPKDKDTPEKFLHDFKQKMYVNFESDVAGDINNFINAYLYPLFTNTLKKLKSNPGPGRSA